MTKYLDKKFSSPSNSKAYVDNWDSVFGDKPKVEPKDIRFPCEVCGKLIWKGWFAPGGPFKCGACCNPPRDEEPAP